MDFYKHNLCKDTPTASRIVLLVVSGLVKIILRVNTHPKEPENFSHCIIHLTEDDLTAGDLVSTPKTLIRGTSF